MFSDFKSYFAGLWMLIFDAASAGEFTLHYQDEDAYLLKTPAPDELQIVIASDGATELNIIKVHQLACAERSFQVPVIKGYIETGISSGEKLEYVVLEQEGGHYTPIKSITSFMVVDRESGDSLASHVLPDTGQDMTAQLCDHILKPTEFDQAIILAEP